MTLSSHATPATYKVRLVGGPSIIAYDYCDGTKLVATPSADADHHRLATVLTASPVGAVGHLRYVSNYPHWGRLEFESGPVPNTEETRSPSDG